MNLRLMTMELKTGKTGLNPDRGRVGVIYVGIDYLGRNVW
jgi:hypothetical protein